MKVLGLAQFMEEDTILRIDALHNTHTSHNTHTDAAAEQFALCKRRDSVTSGIYHTRRLSTLFV